MRILITLALLALAAGQAGASDLAKIPAIKRFVGDGFGAAHAKAPAELSQFGRLTGIWHVEAEMRGMDGSWKQSAPGVWAWKYSIDG